MGYCDQQNEVIRGGSTYDALQVIHKVHKKVHGSKLGHQNHFLIPLCVTEFICSLSPDKYERYTGFQYVDGKMINQLDECKLEDNKLFHIHVELFDENTDIFIEKSSQSICMGDFQYKKQSALRKLDICFNKVDTFIETIGYCYDNMADLCWVNTNKVKFKKSEGGN